MSIFPLTPPTDSLYKFMAIFGLIIFLFSLYRSNYVLELTSKYQTDLEDIKIEIEPLNTNLILDSISVIVAPQKVAVISETVDSLATFIRGLSIDTYKKEELTARLRKIGILNSILRVYITEYWITMAIGIVLMLAGFILWYKKEQSFNDIKLKMSIKEILASTEPNKKQEQSP